MKSLLQEISQCELCAQSLVLGPRPIVAASPNSKLVIIGQAPGLKVHRSGIPWHDKSGDNLRNWLGCTAEQFYDPEITAIVPMGFCYPGKGKSGDLPPRPECAVTWHSRLLDQIQNTKLTLLIGQYAQKYYLGDKTARTLTETVRNFREYLPDYFVLPHPSPRNNIWMARNPWFQDEVLPELKQRIDELLL